MLRNHYRTVFPEEVFEPIDALEGSKKVESGKIFKIAYNVNLLPLIGAHHERTVNPFTKEETSELANARGNFLGVCCYDSEEIGMFQSLNLQEFIDFKWEQYAFGFHCIGFGTHFLYVTFLMLYVNSVYVTPATHISFRDAVNDPEQVRQINSGLLLANIIYPTFYEVVQMSN